MHDVPYTNFNKASTSSCPEIVAAMTRICTDIKQILAPTKIPCGIQVVEVKYFTKTYHFQELCYHFFVVVLDI